MSRSHSDNRAYFDAVQDYFLERTGRGLILSSRDLELLIGWKRSGASAAMICQGIDEAVESLEGAPRDLHACKRFVEPRLDSDAVVANTPSVISRAPKPSTPDDPDEREWIEAFKRLDQAIEQSARPTLREAYAQARARLVAAKNGGTDPYNVFCEIDDWLVDTLYDSLPEEERRMLDLEIEGRFGAHLAMMTDEARAQTRRASLRELLCKRMGLVQLALG